MSFGQNGSQICRNLSTSQEMAYWPRPDISKGNPGEELRPILSTSHDWSVGASHDWLRSEHVLTTKTAKAAKAAKAAKRASGGYVAMLAALAALVPTIEDLASLPAWPVGILNWA